MFTKDYFRSYVTAPDATVISYLTAQNISISIFFM